MAIPLTCSVFIPKVGISYSQSGNILFPRWEFSFALKEIASPLNESSSISQILSKFAHENERNLLILEHFKVTRFLTILQEKRSLYLCYELFRLACSTKKKRKLCICGLYCLPLQSDFRKN